jgi:hypothetical protein
MTVDAVETMLDILFMMVEVVEVLDIYILFMTVDAVETMLDILFMMVEVVEVLDIYILK